MEKRIQAVLEKLKGLNDMIESVIVASSDGLPVASLVESKEEEERLSAMTATLLALGERVSEELGIGAMNELIVTGDKRDIIVRSVGKDIVLAATVKKPAKIGLILYDTKRAVKQIENLFKERREGFEQAIAVEEIKEVTGEPKGLEVEAPKVEVKDVLRGETVEEKPSTVELVEGLAEESGKSVVEATEEEEVGKKAEQVEEREEETETQEEREERVFRDFDIFY